MSLRALIEPRGRLLPRAALIDGKRELLPKVLHLDNLAGIHGRRGECLQAIDGTTRTKPSAPTYLQFPAFDLILKGR